MQRPIPFTNILEGCYYALDWRINGIQKDYKVIVEKKNEDTNTVYVRLCVYPEQLVCMVYFRALIDTQASAADHTWFKGFTLKVDSGASALTCDAR